MPLRQVIPSGSKVILGFVPTVDGAPLIVAHEMGIFRRRGLDVSLSKEVGWASIRGKLMHGELDAAQSIPAIPLCMGLGIGSMRSSVAVPLVLCLQGGAITLSMEISREHVGDGEGLKNYVEYRWRKNRPLILAAPHRSSPHYSLLRTWLERIGFPYPGPIEIVSIPPSLMPGHLAAGLIDGFCAGEPWNSAAILEGSGWSPVRSSGLARYYTESVLVVGGRYLQESTEQVSLLVASIIEACELCQSPEFRTELISMLSRNRYIGVSADVLNNCLGPIFHSGVDSYNSNGLHIFHGSDTNRPSLDKATWSLSELRRAGVIKNETCGSISSIYREDIFLKAKNLLKTPNAKPQGDRTGSHPNREASGKKRATIQSA